MLINVDHKGLEWVLCVEMSQDPVGMQEIFDEIDQHSENQKMLKLPEGKPGRLIAKIFVFRLIYGSVAEGFAQDPDFIGISNKAQYWQELVDTFYKKYKGIELWHRKLVEEYQRTRKIVIPTGREFVFEDGPLQYLRPKLLNYPVQGFGHDIVTVARVSLYSKFKQNKIKSLLICTIHDSILVDAIEEEKDEVIHLIKETWKDIPDNVENLFGYRLKLPTRCEISVGTNFKDMEIVK